MNTCFRWGSEKESDSQKDLDVGGRIILRSILEKENGVAWTGLNWLRMVTSGGLFSTI
jgi:hypothetical protein